MENLINSLDFLVGRRVKDNDDGTDEADGASKLAQDAELLLEEIRAEDGADEDGEGA